MSTLRRHHRQKHGNDKAVELGTKTSRAAKCTIGIDTIRKKKCKPKNREGKVLNAVPNPNQGELRTDMIKLEPLVSLFTP